MHKFQKDDIPQLQEFLQQCKNHDSEIERFQYDWMARLLFVELYNSLYHERLKITFRNVALLFCVQGNWMAGDRKAVLGIVVEEDDSKIRNCAQTCSLNDEYSYVIEKNYTQMRKCAQTFSQLEGCLYLVLQTFSGDEIHILAEEMEIDRIVGSC